MSAETVRDARDVLAEIIGEHSWDMSDEIRVNGVWTWVLCCECGEMPPMAEAHQHIADAILTSDWLAEYVATKQAEALRDVLVEARKARPAPHSRLSWESGAAAITRLIRARADRIANPEAGA